MCENYVFNFLRVCGQYPVVKSRTQKWKASGIGILYNLTFFIAVGYGYQYSYTPFPSKNTILSCAFMLANGSFIASLLSMGFNPIMRHKKLCGILTTFDEIDGKFIQLGHGTKYVKPQVLTILAAVLIVVYTCMSQVLEFYFPLWSRGYQLFYFHQVVVFCATMFLANWWFIIAQLQVRFELLNTILENMRLTSEMPTRIKEGEFWARKLSTRSVKTAPLSGGFYVEESLMNLRQIHLLLCQNSNEIMSYHSPTILFVILNSFMQTICNMYYCINGLIHDNSGNQILTYLIGLLNWNGNHILQMSSVILACNYLKQEVQKLSFIIHSRTARLRDSPRQLQMFSFQASQQELKFSPWEIFTLDLSLLLSMFSQIITYLVIVMNIKTD